MNKFGGWAIQESCYNLIREILPEGKTILEMGSGHGTDALSKHYNMISVENEKPWVGKYNSTYIEVPIRKYTNGGIKTQGLFVDEDPYLPPDLPGEGTPRQSGWYDYKILGPKLESLSYDLILVDGPNGAIGRGGFLKHLDLFNTNVPIIFDDINRKAELQMMVKVSEILNKPCKKLDKHTGYIL
tara:strand:- start:451 stop:1005 length:555 start_codon:yes stop_codon:yes gene_type:complete